MSFSDEKSAARIASMNEGLQAGAKNPSQQFTGGATMYSAAEKDVEVQHSKKKNGRFVNPWPEFRMPGVGGLMKFFWESGYAVIPCDEALDKTLPVVTPDHQLLANPPDHGIHVTWIGHASVLAQFDGISMLCDPIFSSRASMSQWAGPKRYRRPALRVETLPKIDACVISHNHYDHLDKDSVKDLNRRFGAALRWFVPMGLKSWMNSSGCENVVELDWWEESSIPGKNGDVKFVFTPAQHWCKRGPADDNMVLWGSWSVLGPRNKFFFAGDTGYCQAFKQIGGRFGPFDLAAIPIGAYEPRWFMGPQHINPEEAVLVHMDLKSRFSLGIHWGTFNLSNEEYLAPPQDLREALKKHGRTLEEFFVLKHGETRLIHKG